MKQGSAIHQTLEDQVHETFEVSPKTKEDAFGLRIWNVIQGLRTLDDIGMTRELEVWGSIEGQVVNGVIDEISFTVPDEELEKTDKARNGNFLAGQMKAIESFKSPAEKSIGSASHTKKRLTQSQKVYVCDVKTRGISGLPRGAAFRPAKIQLMVYHRLLSKMATGKVDLSAILKRYALNGVTPFTDSFIAQIGGLGDDGVDSTPSSSLQESVSPQDLGSSPPESSRVTLDLLLAHNSISKLWALMLRDFRRVLPNGTASIGNILRAEYRARADGSLIGSNLFPMDDALLDAYLAHAMKLWRGERDPEGVAVEEAYKCRSCEFADACDWRRERAAAGRMQKAWGPSGPAFD